MDQTHIELNNQIEKELPCCKHSDGNLGPGRPDVQKARLLGICIVAASVIIAGVWIYTARFKDTNRAKSRAVIMARLQKDILPERGVVVPVRWGDLGKQLVDAGVIDRKKFQDLYTQRGGLDQDIQRLLADSDNGQLVITAKNAGPMLNLLWALGLANKNSILENGPMTDRQYGGDASQFASTGGWALAVGNPMNHYSHHAMIPLTAEQQLLVGRVARNIYRPCCGNPTHFPDCNHGMAMLGLLELMASHGVGEADMYKAALAVNAYWFPSTYMNIGQYLASKGIQWNDSVAKDILGAAYSSAQGYQAIMKEVESSGGTGEGSCGV